LKERRSNAFISRDTFQSGFDKLQVLVNDLKDDKALTFHKLVEFNDTLLELEKIYIVPSPPTMLETIDEKADSE
jgi:hypothetical protein